MRKAPVSSFAPAAMTSSVSDENILANIEPGTLISTVDFEVRNSFPPTFNLSHLKGSEFFGIHQNLDFSFETHKELFNG